ncbi:uncharacterized protein LOC132311845 [Cornus florida]|uniref:uncharacterized protein LOC132311845 n=1 Tax=Cornus florida TaxID=4283 RepID=UPI00289A5853|nr:uncharacterized protein LOC132311845 [Cornus florida]
MFVFVSRVTMSHVNKKMNLLPIWVLFLLILWFSAAAMAAKTIIPRRVRCRSIGYSGCFNIWFLCPVACPKNCLLDCVACRPVCSCNYPGAICEDPRFVGGDGITFYFHGRKDQDFCLVSDTNLHINAHFIGKRNPNLKRDFTWVQSIGIIFNNQKLLVAAKQTSMWDDKTDHLAISFNDMPISLPASEGSKCDSPIAPLVSITRTSAMNHVKVEVADNFMVNAAVVPITAEESRVHGYNISDEDCFAHLELGFRFYNLSDIVDGVLGQTYRTNYVSKAKVNVPMPVMGGVHKFSSSSIFATDCLASRFGWHAVMKDRAKPYSSLQCGMNGNGMVCKR